MRFTGTIKSFNPQKGWGFIECEQTQQLYGKDMFVLKNALPGGMANKGDEVTFAVVQEHNGPVAAEVQVLRREGAAPPAFPAGGKGMAQTGPAMMSLPDAGMPTGGFLGTVKSFSAETGWGMIASPEMQQTYGKDVFFSKAAVRGGYAAAGEQVYFSIKMEPKGPAAASVQVLWRQQPQFQGPAPGFQQAPDRWAKGGPAMGMAMGAPRPLNRDQLYFGVLKSFNEEKGWGHITCEATNKLYGKDVFLMRGALQGQLAQQGTLLSFKVHMGAKGPQATSVSLLPPGSFRANGEEPTVFTGSIKSFNAEKGWGFIASEDLQQIFGKDIFVHKRELEGHVPSPGEEVQFAVEIDDGGQPVAKHPPVTAPLTAPGGYHAMPTALNGAIRPAPY